MMKNQCKKPFAAILLASAVAVAGLSLAAGNATADLSQIPTPFSFNLVALGNVGTSSSPKTADVQGTAAIVGNLFGSGWSSGLDVSQSSTAGYSLYVGGTASFAKGSIGANGMQVNGNVTLDNFGDSTSEPVVSGGNLYGTDSGTLAGPVTLAGTNQSQLTIQGTLTQNQAYNPAFNPTTLTNYFDNLSSQYSALTPTLPVANTVNKYGTLTISSANSGVQVLDLPAGEFGSSSSVIHTVAVNFSGGSTASNYLIINLPDTALTLNYITFTFSGISASHVLVNAGNLSTFTLNQGGNYNLLAPLANTNYSSGSFAGNLIVNNLTGGGESDLGSFFTPPPISTQTPEPAAIAFLAMGVVGFMLMRKRA